MKIRNLIPVGAMILTTTGCGLLRVNINSSTSTSGGESGDGQSGAAQSAGGGDNAFTGANAKTVKVKIDKGGTNPKLAKMKVLATMNPKKAGFACGFGDYVSKAPNALVTIGAGAENLTIKARSRGDGLLLSKDGKFFCATDGSSLKPKGLTAGTWELRVLLDSARAKKMVKGEGYKPIEVEAVVAFADPSRGQTYDKHVKRIDLAESPQRPLFVTGKTFKGEGFRYGDSRCRKNYGPMPHAIFASDQPVGRVTFRKLWSAEDTELRMQELPKGDGPAKSEGYCTGAPYVTNLDGRVAIHIGDAGKGSAPFGYVVLGADTVADPYKLSPVALPKSVDLLERRLTNHFPFIAEFMGASRPQVKFSEKSPGRNGSEVDKMRQRMFLEAPKQLFVAAKYDLDKNSTRTATGDYPKKGETLLIWEASAKQKHATVFRADGSRWQVLTTALVHADSFSVPSASTRTLDVKDAMGHSGPEDQALLDSLKDEEKKYSACFKRATAGADRQIDAINASRLHWTRANKRRKRQIWNNAESAAERSCGKARLAKKRETTRTDLASARQSRINERLAAIATRLAKL